MTSLFSRLFACGFRPLSCPGGAADPKGRNGDLAAGQTKPESRRQGDGSNRAPRDSPRHHGFVVARQRKISRRTSSTVIGCWIALARNHESLRTARCLTATTAASPRHGLRQCLASRVATAAPAGAPSAGHENRLRGTRTHTKKRAAEAMRAVFSPLPSSGRGDQPVFATVRVRLQAAFVSGWRGRPEGSKRRLGGGSDEA